MDLFSFYTKRCGTAFPSFFPPEHGLRISAISFSFPFFFFYISRGMSCIPKLYVPGDAGDSLLFLRGCVERSLPRPCKGSWSSPFFSLSPPEAGQRSLNELSVSPPFLVRVDKMPEAILFYCFARRGKACIPFPSFLLLRNPPFSIPQEKSKIFVSFFS